MRTFYKIMIIGGGASGLISASILADRIGGKNVVVLEKNDRVGKKLSQTGNGQGNLTNTDLNLSCFHSNQSSFPEYAITKYGAKQIEEFYNNIGIFLCGDGKRYPVSKQASAVTDALRFYLEKKGVTIVAGAEVKNLEVNKGLFDAVTSVDNFRAEKVIVSFGGKAGKPYGTDGTAYNLITSFGHTLTDLYPSLVQLKTKPFKGLKGIKADAIVKAIGDGEKTSHGDLLFTDYGVSGNSIFAVSGVVTRGGKLEVEFLPGISLSQVENMLSTRKALGYDGVGLTSGLLHKMLGKVIFESSNGSIKDYASKIKKFTIDVTGTLDFNFAQVTKGGINTTEVDDKTMQSKLVGGMYVIGEALDVDGDCGGYNLHWAFASASVACDDIIENL